MTYGGETGIRTQERVAPLPVFKTGAFNRSAISPNASVYATYRIFSILLSIALNFYLVFVV